MILRVVYILDITQLRRERTSDTTTVNVQILVYKKAIDTTRTDQDTNI